MFNITLKYFNIFKNKPLAKLSRAYNKRFSDMFLSRVYNKRFSDMFLSRVYNKRFSDMFLSQRVTKPKN